MSRFSRLYQGLTEYDFVGNRKRWFAISGTLLLISALSLSVRQLNLGVDFEGGTSAEVTNAANATVSDVRDALAGIGQDAARVQLINGGEGILVQTEELTQEGVNELIRVIAGVAGVEISEVSSTSVGPTFGARIANKAAWALVVFLALVTVFISIRFEWKMALAGLAALGHDLLLTAGVYSLVGFEVTPATVIAILTILGYSLYDTVVVFDKVSENIEGGQERRTISGIVNKSMNEVVMRSINTSLTSLLPVGSLLFIGSFLLGATTLREFALALFVGITAGTYSSIFFASPLLAVWKEREEGWRRVQTRVARKAGSERAGTKADTPLQAKASRQDTAVAVEDQPARDPKAEQRRPSGAMPRPPKKKRRKR